MHGRNEGDMSNSEADEVSIDKTPEMNRNVKHHSKWSAALISVIFIAAAVTWLFNVPIGVMLTVIGGVIFGVTYR